MNDRTADREPTPILVDSDEPNRGRWLSYTNARGVSTSMLSLGGFYNNKSNRYKRYPAKADEQKNLVVPLALLLPLGLLGWLLEQERTPYDLLVPVL